MGKFNLTMNTEEIMCDVSHYLKDYKFKELEEIELFLEQYNDENIKNDVPNNNNSQNNGNTTNETTTDEYISISDAANSLDLEKNNITDKGTLLEKGEKETDSCLQSEGTDKKHESDVFEDEEW